MRTRTGTDYWTFGHELGHQFQTDDWVGGELTEVAVNLFTLYTLNGYLSGGGAFGTAGFEGDHLGHEELVDYRWGNLDSFDRIHLYRQLVLEFGWDAFKRTFASYYLPEYPREEYGDHLDGFAIRFSVMVERDLIAFFEHWEYPMSEAAAATIRSFELEAWMPPGW